LCSESRARADRATVGWSTARLNAASRAGDASRAVSAPRRSPAPHSAAALPYGPASPTRPRSGAGSARQASVTARTGSSVTCRSITDAASTTARGVGCTVTRADISGRGEGVLGVTITHVLGARPNFVKAAPVIHALAALGHEQRVVHTGQHYDERMSDVFFVQLGLPEPDVNLGVGSGTQAAQTADVLVGMEREFLDSSPSLAVLYGDVNSTIGAALAGAKLGIPLAHVEAGLRSFDNTMPEEINRRLTDQLCDLLFCTSPEALGHLAREGRPDGAMHLVGNPMIDTLLANLDKFDA